MVNIYLRWSVAVLVLGFFEQAESYFAPTGPQALRAPGRRLALSGTHSGWKMTLPQSEPPGSRRDVLRSLLIWQWIVTIGPAAGLGASDVPPPLPSDGAFGSAFEPGGAVLAAQRAAAEAEAAAPQPVRDVRALSIQDVEAMFQLTTLQGWDNTLEDLQLLLTMEGSRAFGIFSSSAQLVSMCACTHLPATGGGVAWLSYVITRKDFRRRGLARRTCQAALQWLDATYPSCSIGLYGEPAKAAPLYEKLGFVDMGKTRFYSGTYSADAILAADASSTPSGGGKRAVNSRVRAITVGRSTALNVGKGSVLLAGVLASDDKVLCSSRGQALRKWQQENSFLTWMVPDVKRTLVAKIHKEYRDSTSGRMTYEGLRALNLKTVGVEVQRSEFDAFCRRIGVSPDEGLSEDALFEIYAQPGNNVYTDAKVLFRDLGGATGSDAGSTVKGWVFGRRAVSSQGSSSYFLGPLVALDRDPDTCTALVVAALRGAAVDFKLRGGAGEFKVEMLGLEITKDAEQLARPALEALGFTAGGQSRYMVRGRGVDFYSGSGDGVIAASSFEFA